MIATLDILWSYRREFLGGLIVTLQLCALIWPIGLILGTLMGVAGARWKRTVGSVARAASFVLSGVPVLVFLFWLHYPLQGMLGVVIDPFYTAVAALSVINTIAVAQAVRRVLEDFPAQFLAAARVCGLSQRQTILRVQLPIVFRQVLPSLLIAQVATLQMTLFASLISVDEIFRIAQRINSEVYKPVQIYSALALLFLLVCLPMHAFAGVMRTKYTRDYSER
jgi:His/Glu/Gln/Arg/opine family amino acid ABC transporter permease subunit